MNGANIRVTAAVLAVVLSAAGCSDSAPGPPAPSSAPTSAAALAGDRAQRLDRVVEQAMSEAAIPGAMIGIWGPDGDYVRAFGVADKQTRAPMRTDFYARIGSQTKTFTVTGLLQLADQGRVGLDDPIAEYVEGVPNGDRITLRQLARMQSGLPNYSEAKVFQQALFADPYRPFTPQQLLADAFTQPNAFAPGAEFAYCNTNTVLLGLVVEKVSGQNLPDYIRDHITAPLGMKHTSFPTTNAFPNPHAQGYTEQTANGAEAVATEWNPSWAGAAGAMISTLDDMKVWSSALATGKLLSQRMQQERLQTVGAPGLPAGDGYGLGLFEIGGWIGHNGSLPGYQTVSVYLPEQKTSLVLFVNTDISSAGEEPGTSLATAITKELTPDHVYSFRPPEPPPSATTTTNKPR